MNAFVLGTSVGVAVASFVAMLIMASSRQSNQYLPPQQYLPPEVYMGGGLPRDPRPVLILLVLLVAGIVLFFQLSQP